MILMHLYNFMSNQEKSDYLFVKSVLRLGQKEKRSFCFIALIYVINIRA